MKKIDLLIRGGLIYDGTGSEPFEGDIGISGDRIAFIHRKTGGRKQKAVAAGRIIDAKDMAVAPGFIDTHAHSEFTLLADPRAEGKISQGITTEINGNCGLSAAPLLGEALKRREEDLKELGIRERWSDFEEYFKILEERGLSMNFASLTGHGNIRACVTGYEDRKSTASEIKKMCILLKKSVKEGAIGLSTGLIYPPGLYADTEELIALSVPCNNLIYTSHMRSEGDRLIESIEEIIRIGSEAGIKVHISHIKTSGDKNWHKIDKAVSLIEESRKKKITVTCDRYPYTAASTDLDVVLPDWVYEGGTEEELKKLKNPEVKEKIKRVILSEHPEKDYWDTIYISSASLIKNRWMEGKSLARIADHVNAEPVDMLLKILADEKLRVGAIFSSMCEENLRRFISLPYVTIGTDSSARSADGPTYKGKPHPRGFGSFPRFLGQYVRDKSLMSLSEAICKITMLPAQIFNIHKRGVLKNAAFADIVLFDYKRIIDKATFDKPFLKPEGIDYVIVNGKSAIWEGELTGIRAGRVLRNGR
ncbi:MAG: D-aminoacylase [Thermodesulfovibrionales bacterium]